MKANKVTVIRAAAEIQGRADDGFAVQAGGETYVGKRLVIASGSETTIPPVPGLKEGLASGFVVTNREVLDRKELPQDLVVIGGGVIGLEMACYFASVGVHVIVVEMMPKIAGPTDEEICKILMDTYGKRGMEFKLSSKVLEVTDHSVLYEAAGEKHEIPCDLVLLSAGRRPFTKGLGLETAWAQL